LKLLSQQEFRGVEDNTTAQVPKVQQLEFTGFQDPQAMAATSGNQYQYVCVYIYIYIYKFFGGKIFSAKRVVFSSNILKWGAQEIFAKNCALLVLLAGLLCSE